MKQFSSKNYFQPIELKLITLIRNFDKNISENLLKLYIEPCENKNLTNLQPHLLYCWAKTK